MHAISRNIPLQLILGGLVGLSSTLFWQYGFDMHLGTALDNEQLPLYAAQIGAPLGLYIGIKLQPKQPGNPLWLAACVTLTPVIYYTAIWLALNFNAVLDWDSGTMAQLQIGLFGGAIGGAGLAGLQTLIIAQRQAGAGIALIRFVLGVLGAVVFLTIDMSPDGQSMPILHSVWQGTLCAVLAWRMAQQRQSS